MATRERDIGHRMGKRGVSAVGRPEEVRPRHRPNNARDLRVAGRHDVLTNEERVVLTGNACMSREQLTKRDPRWSLRFPIFDGEGRVELIGVVSPEFQQGSAATGTKLRRS